MSFDEYAKTWETEKRIARAKIITNKIKLSIGDHKNDSAMEFGCGTGLISFNLYDEFKEITLIDTSQGMIDILTSKIANYKINHMIAKQIDIMNEDISNMKFHVIYSSMVLHHIPDTSALIMKFHDMLHKDGCLCIVDLDAEDGRFHKDEKDFVGHHGFHQENLKDILFHAGFRDIESSTFYYDSKLNGDDKVNYSLFFMRARKQAN